MLNTGVDKLRELRMIKFIFFGICWFCLLSYDLVGSIVAAEQNSYDVILGSYRIEVTDKSISRFDGRNLTGTHSLWWGYQNDLISPTTNESYPSVLSFFRKTKSVIRYGGGANEIPWEACADPSVSRTAVKAVDWAGPMKCQFGISEYLSVLRLTGGKETWLIANIAGIDYQLLPLKEMVSAVGRAAVDIRSAGGNLGRYWELGNELERGRYNWSPEMIAQRASAAGKEIVDRDPDAHLILPLIEFNAPNQPPRKVFNERLLRAMKQSVDGIALHLYYDGAPGGPSIPTQLKTVVETADTFRSITGKAGEVWITEHGRWPEGDGRSKDWKSQWYKTNDLDGVLGTADFLIALAQVGDVAGAMLHGLRAGPWNVFEKTSEEPRLSGVGLLLTLFADTSNAYRLQTHTSSMNQSNYKGGYDIRATALSSADKQTISLWIVNRSVIPVSTGVSLPSRKFAATFIKGSSLTCPIVNGKCSGNQFRLLPVNNNQIKSDKNGLNVVLPARSVTALEFEYLK